MADVKFVLISGSRASCNKSLADFSWFLIFKIVDLKTASGLLKLKLKEWKYEVE
jgi:hypothetical protein